MNVSGTERAHRKLPVNGDEVIVEWRDKSDRWRYYFWLNVDKGMVGLIRRQDKEGNACEELWPMWVPLDMIACVYLDE